MCGIIHDEKLYMPEIMLDDETKTKLLSYIRSNFSSGKQVIYFEALFNKFSDNFLDHTIYNSSMLRSYLAYINEDNEYYVDKNFISKEEKSGSYYSINHEIVYNTDQLFTLKLELNKAHADSYTKNVYYTINKSTGKSIPLSAYFKNSDYKKVISKEILKQMKEEMKKDTNKVYWCQKNDNPRFKGISKNQSYYINKQGELVICFDQFEVAPGYMGNPTFTIKNDLLDDYFK